MVSKAEKRKGRSWAQLTGGWKGVWGETCEEVWDVLIHGPRVDQLDMPCKI